MTNPVQDACETIMGRDLARAIIDDMGLEWCLVAALADPDSHNHPQAREVINKWVAEQKAKSNV